MTRKIRNTGRPIDVSAHLEELRLTLGVVSGLVAVYLYGSYGTRFQTPLSDVDIALVFRDGAVPSSAQHVELIGRVTGALHEDDVSVTILNRAPLAMQHKVLAEGRCLLVLDETALADFVERTVTQYSDFAIDEAKFLAEYDRALVQEYSGGSG